MSENENICPTCNATGGDPCVTASGTKAKKNHAARKIAQTVELVRETAKQRFDRMRDERRARDKKKKETPPEQPPNKNRAARRSAGFVKSAHRGAMKRKKRAKLNAQVRDFWSSI